MANDVGDTARLGWSGMDVHEAIAAANRVLPGVASPDGEDDPRWQAIIEVGEFLEDQPEEVWPFISRWGSNPDGDLRMAVATCLLEHLLEYHFDRFFDRVQEMVRADLLFAETFGWCEKFGQSENPNNAARFDTLRNERGR